MGRNQIIYRYNKQGRSGHALKDLFTSVIFSEMIDGLDAAYSDLWRCQKLIPLSHVQADLVMASASRICDLTIPGARAWHGMRWKVFEQLRDTIQTAGSSTPTLFVIGEVMRVHPFQIANWEEEGKLPSGSYKRVIGRLRRLYWGAEEPLSPPAGPPGIVIHIRRGDVADPAHRMFNSRGAGRWSLEFYRKEIAKLRAAFPESRITICTEIERSEDLDALSKDTTILRGGVESLHEHFRMMITADVFMTADSSLSNWAALISTGKIYQTQDLISTGQNYRTEPSNWFRIAD